MIEIKPSPICVLLHTPVVDIVNGKYVIDGYFVPDTKFDRARLQNLLNNQSIEKEERLMGIISAENGCYYTSEMTPHGTIEFVHVRHGHKTDQTVPQDVCWRLTPPGWSLVMYRGRYEAFRPVTRVSHNELEMGIDGGTPDLYRYSMVSAPSAVDYLFEMFEGGYWLPVRNKSRIESLRYFLTNESLWVYSSAASENGG